MSSLPVRSPTTKRRRFTPTAGRPRGHICGSCRSQGRKTESCCRRSHRQGAANHPEDAVRQSVKVRASDASAPLYFCVQRRFSINVKRRSIFRARMRKRRGSGDSPGLQNRRPASLMSVVRSTRTRFRHLFSAIYISYWIDQLPSVDIRFFIPGASQTEFGNSVKWCRSTPDILT